jgi:hypothetical protein
MTSTVLEKLGSIGEAKILHEGDSYELTEYTWCLLAGGDAELNGKTMYREDDYGGRPFAGSDIGPITTKEGCTLLLFDARRLERLRMKTPQLNYFLRKLRASENPDNFPWKLGPVNILN